LGLLFDAFFYEYDLGVNYLIYLVVMLAGTYWALSFRNEFNRAVFMLFSACMLLLSAIYVTSTNEVFRALNFLLIPALYFVSILVSLGLVRNMFVNMIVYVFTPVAHLNKYFTAAVSFVSSKGRRKGHGAKILLGLLISAAALLIILPLMLGADSAFKALFHDFFDIKINFDTVFKVIAFFMVSTYGFALIYFIYHGARVPAAADYPTAPVQTDIVGQAAVEIKDNNAYAYTLLTFLIAVGLVFLSFSFIQILYLFLKVNAGLPQDFTYASYAREGVFQLWALTAVNILIVFVCEAISRKITLIKTNFFNVIFSVYVGINFAMTASAFYKMAMYESAFGLTRLRMFVFLHLSVQTVLLILLLYKIWVKKFPFFKTAFILCLAFYTAVNFINVDKLIAQRNIAAYEKTGEIDMQYLIYHLSFDAFGEVVAFAEKEYGYDPSKFYPAPQMETYDSEIGGTVRNPELTDEELLLYYLYSRQCELESRYNNNRSWFEYNISADQAIKFIK